MKKLRKHYYKIDKFYTKLSVVDRCIKLIKEHINISNNDLIIDHLDELLDNGAVTERMVDFAKPEGEYIINTAYDADNEYQYGWTYGYPIPKGEYRWISMDVGQYPLGCRIKIHDTKENAIKHKDNANNNKIDAPKTIWDCMRPEEKAFFKKKCNV